MNRLMVVLGCGSLALFCFTSTLFAQSPSQLVSVGADTNASIQWHDDLQSGWQQARKTGRPMVIFITSKRCTYCDAMKQSTWCDQSVLQRIRNGFVAIRLTPDRNADVLKRIHVPAYPTTLVGTPKGRVVGHRIGFQPAEEIAHVAWRRRASDETVGHAWQDTVIDCHAQHDLRKSA